MDGRTHPERGERTIQGHSVGYWDGDVLVVDTANFADHRSPWTVGVPSGSQKRVRERFQLSDDGMQLRLEFITEDPEFLAEPVTGEVIWDYAPDDDMSATDCDPEVARRHTFY